MKKRDPVTLSPRETEVLLLVMKGLSSKKISEKMYLSKRTIDGYREHLRMKTGAKNTAELVAWATRHGY